MKKHLHLRGMYARLADEHYKVWKGEQPKAVDLIQQMKEEKEEYALAVTFKKKQRMYEVVLSAICYSNYAVENFQLHYLDDDMEFDDWYQSVDMNYAITQGILDELKIDFVIDYGQWQDCFFEMRDSGFKIGNIFKMELGAM